MITLPVANVILAGCFELVLLLLAIEVDRSLNVCTVNRNLSRQNLKFIVIAKKEKDSFAIWVQFEGMLDESYQTFEPFRMSVLPQIL